MMNTKIDGTCVVEFAPWLEKALAEKNKKLLSVAAPIVDSFESSPE